MPEQEPIREDPGAPAADPAPRGEEAAAAGPDTTPAERTDWILSHSGDAPPLLPEPAADSLAGPPPAEMTLGAAGYRPAEKPPLIRPEVGPRDWAWFLGPFFLFAAAGFVLGGSPFELAAAGLQVVPFALIALFAYQSGRVWCLVGAILLHICMLQGILSGIPFLHFMAAIALPAQQQPRQMPSLGGVAQVGLTVGAAILAAGVSVVAFLPAARRWAARWLPIRADSLIHAFALSLVCSTTLLCFAQLAASRGLPVLLSIVQHDPDGVKMEAGTLAGGMLFTLAFTIPGAMAAVGFPFARTAGDAMARLGFVAPTLRQVLLGLLAAALLAGAVQLVGPGIQWLWKAAGWPITDEDAFQKLLEPLINPRGALIIGITAGLGEELVVRGVLQPRLGIVLSNLFFTSLHGLQYGFDGLLVVFGVGMALGWIRMRSNTSTSAIVHGSYDIILIMLAAQGIGK